MTEHTTINGAVPTTPAPNGLAWHGGPHAAVTAGTSDPETVRPDATVPKARRAARTTQGLWRRLRTRVQLRRAARLPRSVRLEGRARVSGAGKISFGEGVRLVGQAVLVELAAWRGATLTVGDGTVIRDGTTISAHERVNIGRDCHIGRYAIINDNDYHDIEDKRRVPASRPVVIEDRAWLGARVIVLKGVRIGHDAIVADGSVVTRDVPPRTVVMGHPAKIVRDF